MTCSTFWAANGREIAGNAPNPTDRPIEELGEEETARLYTDFASGFSDAAVIVWIRSNSLHYGISLT